jgi:hypothetical protein
MSVNIPRPFIPVWFDSLGLTANQYRVLCNLWRRANTRVAVPNCFPSAKVIMADCHINKNTVWKVLQDLEFRGLIKRERGRRNSNIYHLLIPNEVGLTEGATSPRELAHSEGHPPAQNRGRPLAETRGRQLAQSEGRKGYTRKVNQIKATKGGEEPPAPWPGSLPPDLLAEIATSTRRRPDEVTRYYIGFLDATKRWRIHYGDTGLAELKDKLRHAQPEELRDPTGSMSSAGELSGAAHIDGPEPVGDWREILRDAPEEWLNGWANREWGTLVHSARAYVVSRLVPAGAIPSLVGREAHTPV